MPKPNPEKKAALIRDLVESIRAEDRVFQMEFWTTTDRDEPFGSAHGDPATCDTASCIAGHLEAIRPVLAAELAYRYRFPDGEICHADLARAIYRAETGEASCPFDFIGYQSSKSLEEITREDAVAHVLGTNPEWPQEGR